jgi:competence protein ComEA
MVDILKNMYRPMFGAVVVLLASIAPVSSAIPSVDSVGMDKNTYIAAHIAQAQTHILEKSVGDMALQTEIVCATCDRKIVDGKLDINTATIQQLEALPKIGPAKAKAIVETRSQKPFRSVADLTRVKGIGAKTALFLQDYVQVQTPSDTPTTPSSAK